MSDEHQWDAWLEAVKRDGINLTTWEEGFIESLCHARERGFRLSEKQVEILERIYAEKTP